MPEYKNAYVLFVKNTKEKVELWRIVLMYAQSMSFFSPPLILISLQRCQNFTITSSAHIPEMSIMGSTFQISSTLCFYSFCLTLSFGMKRAKLLSDLYIKTRHVSIQTSRMIIGYTRSWCINCLKNAYFLN